MKHEHLLATIIESLRLVAAPSDVQVSILPDFVVVTDEIALTYYDAYLLVPQLVDAGLIDQTVARALKQLHERFEQMPQDGSITETKSLESHEYWATARNLAAQALSALRQEPGPPDLSHITWVPGS